MAATAGGSDRDGVQTLVGKGADDDAGHRIFAIKFSKVYPLYVQKAERKNRTKEEVDQIICWLTGYDRAGLRRQIGQENDLEAFFAQAPSARRSD